LISRISEPTSQGTTSKSRGQATRDSIKPASWGKTTRDGIKTVSCRKTSKPKEQPAEPADNKHMKWQEFNKDVVGCEGDKAGATTR